MRLPPTSKARALSCKDRSRQEGSAVLMVLVFLFILELLIMSNARTLDQLKRELKLVEKRQQAKFRPAQVATTNQVPVRLPPQPIRP